MKKLLFRIKNIKAVKSVITQSQKIVLPGFDGIPIYEVARFFLKALNNGTITTRASSIAFKFFMAIFPAIIFLFTIIPYIPIENFQETLLITIRGFVPDNFFSIIKETTEDIVTRQRGGLLSLGFILALYFSANGILGVITAFNSSYQVVETRSIWKKYLISFGLVFILILLLFIAILFIIGGTAGLEYLTETTNINNTLYYYIMQIARWIILIVMLFFGVSFIFYLAPAKRVRFRFISAGSTLATFLFILSTIGFNYFVNNFARYNAIYGSIGTLLVIMLWLYINSIVLIVGFELNAGIANARHNLKTK